MKPRFIQFSLWDVWTSDTITISMLLEHSTLPAIYSVRAAELTDGGYPILSDHMVRVING